MATFQQALLSKTALSHGIEQLYRFVPYDQDRLVSLLKGTMRASQTRYFNDPWDCRPIFDPRQIDDPQALAALLRTLVPLLATASQEAALRLAQDEERLRGSPADRASLMHSLSHLMMEFIQRFCRVVCLSTDVFHPLLWSHYSRGHSGVCYEFNTSIGAFRSAMKVNYCAEYPALDLSGAKPETFADVCLLSKSRLWEYEGEYRIITSELDGLPYPRSKGDFIDVPDGALTAVIVGQQCPTEQWREIQALVREFAPHVEFRSMSRRMYEYGLDITSNAIDCPHPSERSTAKEKSVN